MQKGRDSNGSGRVRMIISRRHLTYQNRSDGAEGSGSHRRRERQHSTDTLLREGARVNTLNRVWELPGSRPQETPRSACIVGFILFPYKPISPSLGGISCSELSRSPLLRLGTFSSYGIRNNSQSNGLSHGIRPPRNHPSVNTAQTTASPDSCRVWV